MKLLTAKEVAVLLRVSKRTVYRMKQAGRLPKAIYVSDKHARWDEQEIVDHLSKRRKQ